MAAGAAGPSLSAAQIANLAAAGLIVGGGGGGGGVAKPAGDVIGGAAPALGGWDARAHAPAAPAVAAPMPTLPPPPAPAPRQAGGPVNLMDL